MNTVMQNRFLQDNYAPWSEENDFHDLSPIVGEIPESLNGVLYRNGPNPKFPDVQKHWFEGDGMLHAFFIRDGKMSYRNRWIETERFKFERDIGKSVFRSFSPPKSYDPALQKISHNTANTNIIRHAGKLLALQETAYPTEIHPIKLNTIGKWDYNGLIPQMCAHPHFDPQTGEMHSYAYKPGTTDIIYYIVNRDGRVTKAEKFTAPFSSFIHDFFITKDYAIFPILPLAFNYQRMQVGKPLLMWEPDLGAHIGIMKRTGKAEEIVWLATDPFYAFHYMNAYQDGDNIILDAMKSQCAHLFPDANGYLPKVSEAPPRLTRFKINIKKNSVTNIQLDSVMAEFPRFDERFTGLPYRHGFVGASVDPKSQNTEFDSIIHYDFQRGTQTIREFGHGNTPNEPIFVPKSKDSREGDGFILTIVFNPMKNTSDFYILDAMHIDQEPVAVIPLPHRIPNGFHGNWYENECDSYE